MNEVKAKALELAIRYVQAIPEEARIQMLQFDKERGISAGDMTLAPKTVIALADKFAEYFK